MDISGLSEQLASDFQEALGDDLLSFSLHALDVPLFWPAHCLAVLRPRAELVRVPGLLAKWRRRGLEAPLLLTRPEVEGSLRNFPLELLNLRLDSRQLVGRDLLAGLEIDSERLSSQCHRELEAKAVVLRRAYCLSTLPEELLALLSASLPLYLAVFRGLLHLAGRPAPLDPAATVARAAEQVSIDARLFDTLTATATGRLKVGGDRLQHLLADYVAEAERLARTAGGLRSGR